MSNTWIRDYRSVNAAEWNSDCELIRSKFRASYELTNQFFDVDFKQRHHETWGKLFQAKDVKVEWHVASQEEIDFTIELLRDIVSPALDQLDALLDQVQGTSNKGQEWTNDFCRVSYPISFSVTLNFKLTPFL